LIFPTLGIYLFDWQDLRRIDIATPANIYLFKVLKFFKVKAFVKVKAWKRWIALVSYRK